MRLTRPRDWLYLAQRFEVDPDTDCWNWMAALNTQGYGVCGKGRRSEGTMLAHRFSYELFFPTVPAGQVIHHLCENSRCVNPDHMTTMTRADHARLHHKGVVHS